MAEKIMHVKVPEWDSYPAIFSDTEKCMNCDAKLLRIYDHSGINRFCPVCRHVYMAGDLNRIIVNGRFIDAETYIGSSQLIVAVAAELKKQGYDLIALASEHLTTNYFTV